MNRRRPPIPLIAALVLATAVMAVYWPVARHGFSSFDDTLYITENRQVRSGLTAASVRWALTTRHAGNWHPLTWLAHMLDVELFGLAPGRHHLMGAAVHAAAAVLLLAALRLMTGSVWRSAAAAGLWALHPLRVESVAWASERKDVLAAFFWMLAMLAYGWYARRPGARRYLAVTAAMALGLLSKPMLVTLPFIFLLLDFWPLGRMGTGTASAGTGTVPLRSAEPVPRLLLEKIPLLLLAAGSSVMTVLAQREWGAVRTLQLYTPGKRLVNAAVAQAAYLKMTIWPSGLAVFYPFPLGGVDWWKVAAALLLLGGVTGLAVLAARRAPFLAAGWLWYLGTLVPVVGLVQVGAQAMADRYTYIPSAGIFLAAVWAAGAAAARRPRVRAPLAAAAAALMVVLGLMAARQRHFWRTDEALFGHAVEVVPDNWVAHNMLGAALSRRGEDDGALRHYRESLRLMPGYAEGRYNLGLALYRRGDNQGALENFLRARSAGDRMPEVHNALGTVLAALGRPDEAEASYRRAVRLNPDMREAYSNLGILLAGKGLAREAEALFRQSLAIDPYFPEALYNLALILSREGRAGEAAEFLRRYLALAPGDGEARHRLESLVGRGG